MKYFFKLLKLAFIGLFRPDLVQLFTIRGAGTIIAKIEIDKKDGKAYLLVTNLKKDG
jgi:hypothetical protein